MHPTLPNRTRADDVEWIPQPGGGLVAVECWNRDLVDHAKTSGEYLRYWFPNESRAKDTSLETELKDWLDRKRPLIPINADLSCSKALGGLRVVFCDAAYMKQEIYTSRRVFELIEGSFGLDRYTLCAAFMLGGTDYCWIDKDPTSGKALRIHIVIKTHQKRAAGSLVLSLSHEIAANRTDAFICGDGVVTARKVDMDCGRLQDQILSEVRSSCPSLWNNPLFLPSIIHQIYIDRLDLNSQQMTDEMVRIEEELNVTTYEGYIFGDGGNEERRQELDTEEINKELLTLATHLIYSNSACKWVQELSTFLFTQEILLRGTNAISSPAFGFDEIQQRVLRHSSQAAGLVGRFRGYQERANLQINVLSSIISQRGNALALRDSRMNVQIAKSSKQDSMVMTILGSITAIFLPSTLVAAILSMPMVYASESLVASNFGIFWGVAIPLTLITVGCSYSWSRHARKKWESALDEAEKGERSLKQSSVLVESSKEEVSSSWVLNFWQNLLR